MHAGGPLNGSGVDDRLRLIIVDSPDVAAPLIDALDVADVGAWMWVEAERSLYFSPRVLDLLGLSPEPRADLLTRFFQSVHQEDQEPVRSLLLGSMSGGPFKIRYRFTPVDGPLRWIEDRGRVERDAAGVLIRQGGSIREVTDEVGHALERIEADARLEALVNAMPFAVWGRTGNNLTVSHQNAASIAQWGDMRGRALSDAPEDVRAIWQQQLAEVMSGQVVRTRREHPFDKEVRVFDDIIAPVIVEQQVTGAVGVAIEVTEEARASRFQALVSEIAADFASRSSETLDAGVAVALERVGRFLGAPLAVLCEIGPNQRNRLQVTHYWVDPATGKDRPRLMDLEITPIISLLDRVAHNSAVVVRSREELAEGSVERAWLAEQRLNSFAMVPMRQVDGTQTLLGLAGTDDQLVAWPSDTVPCIRVAATLLGSVVARARADADSKAAERRIQDTHKLESLGVLAGGIAHDFNNLLTAILGNASLLRAELAEQQHVLEGIEQIEAASRRAAELCRQMLAFAGRGRFALQLMDLNALLDDMQASLDLTLPPTAQLAFALAPSLPAVLADEAQIRQLVVNLVLNAVEASSASANTVTISTSVGDRTADELANSVFSPELPAGRYVSLSIRDDGHGMSPETLARIFDPFFSTRFTGRGLGLAAVVGIVRAHKGALRVRTAVDVGSTFELLLPAQEGPATPPPEALSPAKHASLASWRTTGTALVVDDEAGVRDLVRTVLERAGMRVVVADSGEKGIAEFNAQANDVRLLLVDLTMPGLDGRETLREIRKIRPDVAAILMSGYSSADLANSDAYAFLQKPFTPATLRSLVKRVLEP